MTSIFSHHSSNADDDLSFGEEQKSGEEEEFLEMTTSEERQEQTRQSSVSAFLSTTNNDEEFDSKAGENENYLSSSLLSRRSSNFPTSISIRSSINQDSRTSLRGSLANAFHFENEDKEKSFFQDSRFKVFQNVGKILAGLPGIIMVIMVRILTLSIFL